ncbi:MAG: indole-3-glycerol phosphate synthase TrpC [Prevotella sp.]
MKDVLEEIVAYKRIEVERFKEAFPESAIHARVEGLMTAPEGSIVPSMRKAIAESPIGIIAEFKRKSPSKGWIKEEGRADVIPLSYQQNGAAAISILTDEEFFGGSDKFIVKARQSGVTIPVLYKNFVIDEYQLFLARLCGASAVLLIAAELSKAECKSLLHTAHELQLEALLEMHSEEELEYADLEPDLCGINNRNLGTFITSVDNSFRLASLLPAEAVKVSESGISNPQTIRQLKQAGFQGFLIGECFMKQDNPGEALAKFTSEI